jgi:hypothetical protein
MVAAAVIILYGKNRFKERNMSYTRASTRIVRILCACMLSLEVNFGEFQIWTLVDPPWSPKRGV